MAVLKSTDQADRIDLAAQMQRVRNAGGPGPWRQLLQILRARIGIRGFNLVDYYINDFWAHGRDRSFRREYLSNGFKTRYNHALIEPKTGDQTALIEDKLATEALFRQNGLPVVETRAVIGPVPDGMELRALASVEEVADFLLDPRNLPLFAKPRTDSFARGAASILSADPETGELTLGDGTTCQAAALAGEMHQTAGGYLLQTLYRCEAGMQKHAGIATPAPRICTIRTSAGVRPFYAVLRLPAATAMHDGGSKDERAWARIDVDTGEVGHLYKLLDPVAPTRTHWCDPDRALTGTCLPHWSEAVAACVAGHDLFPAHGILGWDVFLTETGAVLNEVNANPAPIYQLAARRGLRNPEMEATYQDALTLARGRARGTA
ncbi:hypothetical protein EU803_14675 [Loktanella sp. IMCC34160]|uniref:sugar-transfer associated ATP-grasp domain-containing protein n=1 Tax=Loktanella sp. IMCC34160 TaxID=2510646 RepID=UPI00101DCE63|nr:sugar-transfer associated ATP-grasp domain-containing protein [Loktanella sp. IMCC34160]RYG90463.1 hypothetical protein EU803_14675 [Loktanella sp. IMCC34160]